ncbi:porin [Sandaracinobacter sp. RS1-74]|uniref:porin n=1 Tax=Sandaracinobacteroides sayramensis TaxID=2913411 RepID=UPI001EDB208E|nr:porin [Sandaracinobacteroides sayramensis]MCG2841391.1 porin [Sandaracinobacteroides sayramensis]
MGSIRAMLRLGAALAAFVPAAAMAQTPREAELEARLKQLEAAVGDLRAELEGYRAANAAASAPAALPAEPVAVAAPAAEAKGFRSGASSINIGGYVKTVASFSRWGDGVVASNSLGRDFYLPSAIPVGGEAESTDSDFSAKQTRLWLNIGTDVAGHVLKGYVETDFQTSPGAQGNERVSNGYTLALRRAFVQFDKLTIGQDWTTFQNVAVLPESTDYVGPTEGTVFARQPLVRLSLPLGKGLVLHASAENAETASSTLGSPALVENDDDRLPDFAARLVASGGWGEASLAGIVRQLSVENGAQSGQAAGWGFSGAGKLLFGGGKQHDLRLMATYGSGIGRYVGLNFAADALTDPATGRLSTPEIFAGLAAVKISLAPGLRTTLMGSYLNVAYEDGLAGISGFNKRAWSVAGNLFYSPVKALDLGVELRHGERRLVDGASGTLDRLEFAAKYSF